MFKPLSKVLVVVAMLTAFVGQALAYTSMFCEMSADSHQSHMTMEHSSMKSHEGMEHGDMKASASSSKRLLRRRLYLSMYISHIFEFKQWFT